MALSSKSRENDFKNFISLCSEFFFFFFKKKLKILITELKCEIFLLNEKNKNEILKYC